MFFGSPAIVARARKNVLELYFPPKNQFYKLEIPQSVVNFMDVINEEYFVKYLMDFLIKLDKKSAHVDLVLDSEVVFEKIISKSNSDADKIAIDDFFSSVPLEQVNKVRKIFPVNEQYFLYVANKAFFNSIVRAFAKYGWRINYVAPLGIFGFNAQNQVLSDENLKLIRKGKNMALRINFLDERKPDLFP